MRLSQNKIKSHFESAKFVLQSFVICLTQAQIEVWPGRNKINEINWLPVTQTYLIKRWENISGAVQIVCVIKHKNNQVKSTNRKNFGIYLRMSAMLDCDCYYCFLD